MPRRGRNVASAVPGAAPSRGVEGLSYWRGSPVDVPDTDTQTPDADANAAAALGDLLAVRTGVLEDARQTLEQIGADPADPDLLNLAHYLSLRRHDLRPLQRRLTSLGLSSLGRLEGRVRPSLDATVVALAALCRSPVDVRPPSSEEFFAGERRLAAESDLLFGPRRARRRTRIMVTLPTEAGLDRDLAEQVVAAGADVVRINCAHDDPDLWRAMVGNLRAAADVRGHRLSVLMDIAGPKLRTGSVGRAGKDDRLRPGDRFALVDRPELLDGIALAHAASIATGGIVAGILPGERVRYDDGKLEGVVDSNAEGVAMVRVSRAKAGGVRLKPDKGLNFPDSDLAVSALTHKDRDDLRMVVELADIVGYSFVSRPSDIDVLDEALRDLVRPAGRSIGLVAKIERPEAVRNLPALIARARKRGPFGIMIARGDLAAELGFERLAEMQEEILWLAEAARVPVIWATQVLESLIKDGVPSRGDMTDAAMAARAECVMLNKGPHVTEAMALLDGLLERMDGHLFKKSPLLRALKSW